MPIETVNGADLYYEVHGSGDPLFLTHGSWGDATGWASVIPALAKRFEVIVWDRRGHTRSSAGEGPHTIDQDAVDLGVLIEQLGRQPAHVYGSSSGGTVVLKLLATRPELVRTAAVHEPAVPGLLADVRDEVLVQVRDDTDRHLTSVASMIEEGQYDDAAEYFFENVAVGPGSWSRFPAHIREAFVENAPTYGEELADPTAVVVDVDTLANLNVPLLVTIGTESPAMLREAARLLTSQLPRAHVEFLEGTGHVPYRTHPDLWIATLLDFLDREQ